MTTISYKNFQNTNMRSMAQHKRFRKAVNDKIHAVKYVINRVDISWNAMTKKYEEDRYLAIVDDSPLIHKFGVSLDYRAANVLVFDRNDDDEKGAAMAQFAVDNLKEDGLLFFEINEFLGSDMIQLLKDYHFKNIELKQDIFKKDRMIKGQKSQ